MQLLRAKDIHPLRLYQYGFFLKKV